MKKHLSLMRLTNLVFSLIVVTILMPANSFATDQASSMRTPDHIASTESLPLLDVVEIIPKDQECFVVNDTEIVRPGENYENTNTGEYFRWETGSARSAQKKFSFKIRYTIKSSSFTINASQAKLSVNAHVKTDSGTTVSGYNGHLYSVSLLHAVSTKTIQCSVGYAHTGTFTGLSKGKSYYVYVVNNDELPATKFLVGNGSISW